MPRTNAISLLARLLQSRICRQSAVRFSHGAGGDPFLWTAIQSSLHPHNVPSMARRAAQLMTDSVHRPPAIEFWRGLIQTTRGFNDLTVLEPMANVLANSLLDESSNSASDNRAHRLSTFA